MQGNMDTVAYMTILENTMEPFIDELYLTLQQDGAPAHRVNLTEQFFMKLMSLLSWDAHSPDMDVMENYWFHLSRAVYDVGRQFE